MNKQDYCAKIVACKIAPSRNLDNTSIFVKYEMKAVTK